MDWTRAIAFCAAYPPPRRPHDGAGYDDGGSWVVIYLSRRSKCKLHNTTNRISLAHGPILSGVERLSSTTTKTRSPPHQPATSSSPTPFYF